MHVEKNKHAIVPRDSVSGLLSSVRALLHSARQAAFKSVNTIQVVTNYEIGKRIVRYEQSGKARAEYGKRVLAMLSGKLAVEFGRGFSVDNLANMRKFYLIYQNHSLQISEKASRKSGDLSARVFNLSWSHYVFLCGISDAAERGFYEIEAIQNNWSLPEMRRQFDSGLYERLALSRDKKSIQQLAKTGQTVTKAGDIFKEPYVLEFLGLDEKAKYSESDLESAIIDKIEHFLLELGKGFLFEARQKRFTFDDEHFFVDLVFYNRLLRCYVLIDLKIGKLTHQNLNSVPESYMSPVVG